MKLRSFLLEQKPLLEVLLAMAGFVLTILLGIMAIALTVAANRISTSQLRLAERQTAVAELQLQPRFRFALERITDEALGTYEILQIYNDGAPIEAFGFGHSEFIEVSRTSPALDRRLIPAYYFVNDETTGNPDGLLVTLSSLDYPHSGFPPFRNATQASQELQNTLRTSHNINWERIHFFVRLYYIDAIGLEHTTHYEVNPASDVHTSGMPRRLSSDVGFKVAALFESGKYLLSSSVLELTAASIIDQWRQIPKTEVLGDILLDVDNHHMGSPNEMADRFGGFRDL